MPRGDSVARLVGEVLLAGVDAAVVGAVLAAPVALGVGVADVVGVALGDGDFDGDGLADREALDDGRTTALCRDVTLCGTAR